MAIYQPHLILITTLAFAVLSVTAAGDVTYPKEITYIMRISNEAFDMYVSILIRKIRK